jgi:hypothetical protein
MCGTLRGYGQVGGEYYEHEEIEEIRRKLDPASEHYVYIREGNKVVRRGSELAPSFPQFKKGKHPFFDALHQRIEERNQAMDDKSDL